jgi:predicted nucleic acid-binding protein
VTDALVIDCSAFLASVLPDENCPGQILSQMRDTVWVAPAHWASEVGNSLLVCERRNRIKPGVADDILESLRDRPLELEPATLEPALRATLAIARQHKLTVYDAAYLELALRRKLPLATLDDDLRRGAKKAGVTLA